MDSEPSSEGAAIHTQRPARHPAAVTASSIAVCSTVTKLLAGPVLPNLDTEEGTAKEAAVPRLCARARAEAKPSTPTPPAGPRKGEGDVPPPPAGEERVAAGEDAAAELALPSLARPALSADSAAEEPETGRANAAVACWLIAAPAVEGLTTASSRLCCALTAWTRLPLPCRSWCH